MEHEHDWRVVGGVKEHRGDGPWLDTRVQRCHSCGETRKQMRARERVRSANSEDFAGDKGEWSVAPIHLGGRIE